MDVFHILLFFHVATAMALACTHIRVSGARYQTVHNGVYSNRGRTCDGHPRYYNSDSDLYLYYNDDSLSWGISDVACHDESELQAYSTASTPDRVLATWEEYNKDDDTWEPSINITVQCYYPPIPSRTTTPIPSRPSPGTPSPDCTHIRVSGARYQPVINGVYSNRGRTCDGHPRYYKSVGGLYLYYHDEPPESWGIGNIACSDWFRLLVYSIASTPDRVFAIWEELNNDYTWQPSARISVKCYSSASRNSGYVGAYLVIMVISKLAFMV